MTPSELTEKRTQLGLKPGELSRQLNTSRKTLGEWEGGRRRIPGICEAAVDLLLEKDRWVLEKIAAQYQVVAAAYTIK